MYGAGDYVKQNKPDSERQALHIFSLDFFSSSVNFKEGERKSRDKSKMEIISEEGGISEAEGKRERIKCACVTSQ